MSVHRWNARRDANEPEIRKALTKIGAKYLKLNAFDLLVLYQGQLFMLEVKIPRGEVQPSQQELLDDGWPLKLVSNVAETLEVVALHPPKRPNAVKKRAQHSRTRVSGSRRDIVASKPQNRSQDTPTAFTAVSKMGDKA